MIRPLPNPETDGQIPHQTAGWGLPSGTLLTSPAACPSSQSEEWRHLAWEPGDACSSLCLGPQLLCRVWQV